MNGRRHVRGKVRFLGRERGRHCRERGARQENCSVPNATNRTMSHLCPQMNDLPMLLRLRAMFKPPRIDQGQELVDKLGVRWSSMLLNFRTLQQAAVVDYGPWPIGESRRGEQRLP